MELAQLGDRAKDSVTGVTGVVVCVTTWLNGCVRVGIQSETPDKDGKPMEAQYFDQSQLVVVKRSVHKPIVFVPQEAPKVRNRTSGGPARESSGFAR